VKADPDILLATMAKADEKLAAAQRDMDAGFPGEAASHAYYSAFHAATAVLASHGLSFSSHRETIGAFVRTLVNTGAFPSGTTQKLQKLFDDRQIADYAIQRKIEAPAAAEDIAAAQAIVEACRTIIDASIAQ